MCGVSMMKKIPGKAEYIETVSCEQCCSDIPLSAENKDYVQHFCGIECYERWSEKTSKENITGDVYIHHPDEKSTM